MIVPLRNPEEIYPRFDYGLTAEERKSDWLGKFGTGKKNETGTTLTDLKCPSCDKSKMWSAGFTPEKSYLVAKCHSCDHKLTHRDQFPERYEKDFFRSFEKKNPNVPFESIEPEEQARHYLASRGIPVEAIRPGAARVENIPWGPGYVVYFQDSSGEYLNGRVITPKEKGSKSYNKKDSQTGNKYFKATETIDKSRPVYVAEAPIKALALNAMGLQAISVYSSNFNEENKLFEDYKDYDLRGAFDNDDAGLKALKCFIEIRVKQGKLGGENKDDSHLLSSNKKEDWDDYLKERGVPISDDDKEKKIREWNDNAYIALSSTAMEWINRTLEKGRFVPSVFTFDGCTYGKKEKVVQNIKTTEAIKFFDAILTLEARIIDQSNLDRDRYSWAFKITPKGRSPKFIRDVHPSEIKGEALETLLLESAEVVFRAESKQWKPLIEDLLKNRTVPEATRIDYAGYHLESGCFITPHWGVDDKGNLMEQKPIGSYSIGKKDIIPLGTNVFTNKATSKSSPEERFELVKAFIGLQCQAYPMDAGLVLTYAVASLFVPLFKENGVGFPFLAISGDKGTGKTDRIATILEAFGMETEGISLQSANKKGWVRELSHLSGAFYYLDEANEEERGAFRDKLSEFESKALSYYKKTTTQTQGERNQGNSVHKNYFRSTFVFTYNRSPWKNPAMKSRIIEIKAKKEHLEIEGAREAYEEWKNVTEISERGQVVIGLLEALQPYIKEHWKAERDKAQKELNAAFPGEYRATEDYALILAVNRMIRSCFGLNCDVFSLEAQSLETGKQSKIHSIMKKNLTRIQGSDSTATTTLLNALVGIGAIDLEKQSLEGIGDKLHHSWVGKRRGEGRGLFVCLTALADKFPIVAREKAQIEEVLKRMSGVIPNDTQKVNGDSVKGWFLPLETVRDITRVEDD
jgi:hypothetical protein